MELILKYIDQSLDKMCKTPKRLWENLKWRRLRRFEILYAYLKQGWKTEDWDSFYIIEDLRFKIRRVKDHIIKYDSTRKDAKKMQEVLDILDRIQADEYGDKYSKVLTNKYGPLRMYCEFCPKDKNKTAVIILRDAEKKDLSIREKVSEEVNRYAAQEEKDRKVDIRRAFRLIEKNIDRWWN